MSCTAQISSNCNGNPLEYIEFCSPHSFNGNSTPLTFIFKLTNFDCLVFFSFLAICICRYFEKHPTHPYQVTESQRFIWVYWSYIFFYRRTSNPQKNYTNGTSFWLLWWAFFYSWTVEHLFKYQIPEFYICSTVQWLHFNWSLASCWPYNVRNQYDNYWIYSNYLHFNSSF